MTLTGQDFLDAIRILNGERKPYKFRSTYDKRNRLPVVHVAVKHKRRH